MRRLSPCGVACPHACCSSNDAGRDGSGVGHGTTTFNVLLGVVLGALLAFIPQTVNWVYDSYQRRKERRLVAKREVLLKAAEGAAFVADVIVSYFHGRTSWADALKAAPGWMHKVHAVGTDATVRAFMDAHDCASEAIAELEILSHRIGQKRSEYERLSDWRESATEFYDKFKDPEYMKILPDRKEKQFEIMNSIMKSFGQQSDISEERKKLERELMRRAVEWASKYDGYVTTAMLQVRRELTFTGASKEYHEILATSSGRSQALYERLMAELAKDEEDDEKSEETPAEEAR
jgi:hypothetical protein